MIKYKRLDKIIIQLILIIFNSLALADWMLQFRRFFEFGGEGEEEGI